MPEEFLKTPMWFGFGVWRSWGSLLVCYPVCVRSCSVVSSKLYDKWENIHSFPRDLVVLVFSLLTPWVEWHPRTSRCQVAVVLLLRKGRAMILFWENLKPWYAYSAKVIHIWTEGNVPWHNSHNAIGGNCTESRWELFLVKLTLAGFPDQINVLPVLWTSCHSGKSG